MRVRSMIHRAFTVVIAALCLATTVPAAAQEANKADDAFTQRSPRVGEPIPDLVAFDADGKPFPLSKLRGNYTVLVFGCLT